MKKELDLKYLSDSELKNINGGNPILVIYENIRDLVNLIKYLLS